MIQVESPESLFAKANSLFIDEDFEAALKLYNEAIELDDKQANFFEKRAACNIKLGKLDDAIKDANCALQLDPNLAVAHLRKGIAYFDMEKFEKAKECFEMGLKIDPDSKQLKTWLRKAISECPPETAEEKKIEQKEITKTLKHTWYQTTETVVLDILIKNVPKGSGNITFEEQSVRVIVNSYDVVFELYDKIIPNECKINYYSSKIEIVMKKKIGNEWKNLTRDVIPEETIDPKKYPTAYSSKKDWDELEKLIKKEEEEEKPEGDEALHKLFQKIYAEGSDDTKRAMMKSYIESGGTVLSTNWEEVKKQKVTPRPPDGMEAKKWNE